MNLNKIEKELIQVERACGDLRRGMPVCVTEVDGEVVLLASPDNLSYISWLSGVIDALHKKLVLSKTRAEYLFPDYKTDVPIAINADNLSANEIVAICSAYPYLPNLSIENIVPATAIEQSALCLAKISELIPAVLVFEIAGEISDDFISVSSASINSYMENSHYAMVEACRAPLNLSNAKMAEIVAYRPNIGGAEHYAIIVGKPGEQPLVRVHSSCYTGDLLASLACDCRDQLQSAIELMANGDGGVILYLMQEGRGIGLVNKLRTYNLQHQGADTVEANRVLGFDDDERLFLPAAEILRKLKINTVNLLTNNPLKAKGLEECGIKVASCVPHIMESNQHNESYLQTKADKMGHRF